MIGKKTLLVAGAVTTLGTIASVGLGSVYAATNTSGSGTIVDKIATKFNLNKDEVQKVFEEDRAEKETEHQQAMEERLTQAVTDGKLTEDQKAKILAKMAELKANRPNMEELKNKTPEERHQLMEQHRTELEQWAKDNNIPEEYMPFHIRVKAGGGPGGPEGGVMMFTKEAPANL